MFKLICYDDDPGTAYLELRDHPHRTVYGIIARTVDIHNLIDGYQGPRISLQFDSEDRPIGIEIIYSFFDDDDGNEMSE